MHLRKPITNPQVEEERGSTLHGGIVPRSQHASAEVRLGRYLARTEGAGRTSQEEAICVDSSSSEDSSSAHGASSSGYESDASDITDECEY